MSTVWEPIVARMLADRDMVLQFKDLIEAPMFQDNQLGLIWDRLCEFVEEYQKLPTMKELILTLHRLPVHEKDRIPQHVDRIEALMKVSCEVTHDVAVTEALESVRQYQISQLILDGTAMLETGKVNYEQLQSKMRDILSVTADSDLGLELSQNPEPIVRMALAEERFDSIKTGIANLDKSLEGGWYKGQFFCGIGPSGVGKSTFLVNHAVGGAQDGKNVLLLTVELQAPMVAERVIRRVAKRTRYQLMHELDETTRWVKWFFGVNESRLIIKYAEPGKFTVSDLDGYLDRLKLMCDFTPDLLVIDYLDEMRAEKDDRRQEVRHQHHAIARGLVGLAKMRNIAVCTMTQTNRQALGKKKLTELDIGEDYGKIKVADLVYAICQTQEEYDARQARLRWIKKRDLPGRGQEIPIMVDYSRMIVAGLGEEIMELDPPIVQAPL